MLPCLHCRVTSRSARVRGTMTPTKRYTTLWLLSGRLFWRPRELQTCYHSETSASVRRTCTDGESGRTNFSTALRSEWPAQDPRKFNTTRCSACGGGRLCAQKQPPDFEKKLVVFQRFVVKKPLEKEYRLGEIGNADQTLVYFDSSVAYTGNEKCAKEVKVKTAGSRNQRTTMMCCTAMGESGRRTLLLRVKLFQPGNFCLNTPYYEPARMNWVKAVCEKRLGEGCLPAPCWASAVTPGYRLLQRSLDRCR